MAHSVPPKRRRQEWMMASTAYNRQRLGTLSNAHRPFAGTLAEINRPLNL
jgi:hypothetical protein